MKISRGGSENFSETSERGALKKLGWQGSENLHTLKQAGGGAPKKLNH